MTRLATLTIAAAAMLIPPLVAGGNGLRTLRQRDEPARLPGWDAATIARVGRPPIDTAMPTVVVLLGTDITEITDALGPYEMFARTRRYNVVTASVERQPTLLSGGLVILPHYSLAELDALLGGAAAVVIVPNIPNVTAPANRPLIDWLRSQAQAGAMIHSWCKGAMAVAETELLDGKVATAHWGDIGKLERRYPQVTWARGVRWVEHGQFIMSAGITSGIDASLRAITRLLGDSVARRIAREMRYHDYRYAIDPKVGQYALRTSDLVLLANASYRAARPTVAVALYDGIGEVDLSNVYDTHVYTFAVSVETVSRHPGAVVTAHGLTVFPSLPLSHPDVRETMEEVDRLIVPGIASRQRATDVILAIQSLAPHLVAEHVHADQPTRFGLEPVLEDLARTADVPTARFAQRRMEYRSGTVRLEGSAGAWHPLSVAMLQVLAGFAMVAALARLRRNNNRGAGQRIPVKQVETSRTGVLLS